MSQAQDAAAREGSRFQLIDRNTVLSAWNGVPTTLLPAQNVNMPQAPNGSMVLAYMNQARQNSQGTLSVTSGGSAPQMLQAYALLNQPNLLVSNWKANNLSLTNISPTSSNIPIWVAAMGPGMVGMTPAKLPNDGTRVSFATGQSAQGVALPQWMNLTLSSNTSQLTVFALIGGPPDATGNNAYVIAINCPSGNTGPGTGATPPAGYSATTGGNQYTFQLNWGSSNVYVANLSPATAAVGTVSLYPL
jgi:hypothetical protein